MGSNFYMACQSKGFSKDTNTCWRVLYSSPFTLHRAPPRAPPKELSSYTFNSTTSHQSRYSKMIPMLWFKSPGRLQCCKIPTCIRLRHYWLCFAADNCSPQDETYAVESGYPRSTDVSYYSYFPKPIYQESLDNRCSWKRASYSFLLFYTCLHTKRGEKERATKPD